MNKLMRMEADHFSPPDLLVLFRALWAGKWLIASSIAAALALAGLHLYFAEPSYTATASLLLHESENKVVNFKGSTEGAATQDRIILTEAKVLQSRGLARKLVENLRLVEDPEFNPFLEGPPLLSVASLKNSIGLGGTAGQVSPQAMLSATVNRILTVISVAHIPETFLFRIDATSRSPEKAALLANTLARLYIESRLQSQFEATSEATEWLGGQVSELKDDLEKAEAELKAFTASAEMRSSESVADQSRQIKELRERQQQTVERIDLLTQRIAALNALAAGARPDVSDGLARDPLMAPFLLRAESGRVPEASEIALLVTRTEAEREREARLEATLAASITELEGRIERQSAELVKQQQLEREVEANTAVYEFALGRLKELSVERGVRQAGAHVLSQAEPPLASSGPGAGVVAALALALGAVAGIGLVLARQRMQDTVRTAEDIEKLFGLPVLGQIPKLPAVSRQSLLEHVASNQTSPFSEAMRNLRTSILSREKDAKVIVLASALPGEGKTTQALALARSLSLIGKDVLVIDADLRRRLLGQYFQTDEGGPGLIAAILDRVPLAKAVIHSKELRADILLSEECPYNAADIFSYGVFKRLLEEAKRKYEFIIIDTPPALIVPDARLIAQSADLTLLVVRWNKTTRLQIMDAIRELETANAVVNGCILSRVDPNGMTRYGYGDRYGAYAGHRAGYFS